MNPDPPNGPARDVERVLVGEGARGLIEAAPDAVIVTDRAGRILFANGQTERLFGYSRAELLDQPIEVLVPERSRGQHPGHRERFMDDPHLRPMGHGLDLFGRRRDGTQFPVEISLSPIATDAGTIVMSAVRDITDRKRLEENIRRQNQALEEQYEKIQQASRMKSEFLANMSHELRTPLNSIIGFAELMFDGRVGAMAPQHHEFVGDILTSARHLLNLINDVLDLAKVEAGKMEFFPSFVPLPELMTEVVDLAAPIAVAKGIDVRTDVEPEVAVVWTDDSRLKQVLANYLSNAIKFSHEGGSVTLRARAEGPDAFRVEVSDNGIGIRPEDVDRLFTKFEQLDAGPGKRFQGTGLGLSLTRVLVEAQHGRVGLTSELGKGSTFFAVLPNRPPATS
jgi:protein-histidine pros-kinase